MAMSLARCSEALIISFFMSLWEMLYSIMPNQGQHRPEDDAHVLLKEVRDAGGLAVGITAELSPAPFGTLGQLEDHRQARRPAAATFGPTRPQPHRRER